MIDYLSLTAEKFHENHSSSIQIAIDHWDEIPYFNPTLPNVKDGQICRYRGMIQDMPNPVYYYYKYEVSDNITGRKYLRCGKYCDSLRCEENESLNLESAECEKAERRPYFMIPVPGVSEWAQLKSDQNAFLHNTVKTSSTEKQQPASLSEPKRPAEEMEVDNSENESQKRHCNQPVGQSSSSCTPDINNKALNDPGTIGCLVVIYDIPDETIKLNEVFEVVGFVYSEPLPVETDEFDDSYKPPSPVTPRLHAVSFRKIVNFNPHIKSLESNDVEQLIAGAESIRSDLHLALSQLFFGDTLVADYLLCHLISQIYHRDESDVILGKFSLNIFRVPERYFGTEFFSIISKLLPKVLYYPFSIENLNNSRLLPRKNYKTGNLETGFLQLSDHTHLVIDETKLTEGRLQDAGVRNFNALQSLIKRQKLEYDFTYYTVGFSTDIPVLILSQTQSILPSDVQLCLKPDKSCNNKMEESFEAVNKFLNESLLEKLRVYLSFSSNLSFTLPESFQTIIQNDFVSLRQQDPSFNANDLHELLVISRFLSLSYCKKVLTEDLWEKAKSMIVERRARSRLQ